MMNFPVHYYAPPVESAVCLHQGFTPDECDQIVDMCELIAHQEGGFAKGRVGTNVPGGEDRPDARITNVVWLNPTHENDWVHHRISHMVARTNFEKFHLDLIHFDGHQFSQYLGSEEGHYDWHVDVVDTPQAGHLHRKLSVSVILSEPEDYEGGELLFNVSGNQDRAKSMKPKKGDIVFFYSHVPHKVMPVTKGVRNALVTWVMGEKPR